MKLVSEQEPVHRLAACKERGSSGRHRTDIVRNNDPVLTCRMAQDLFIWQFFKPKVSEARELDGWLDSNYTANYGVMQILVG